MLLTLDSFRECDTRGRPGNVTVVDVPLPVPGQDHAASAWLVTEDDERWPRPAVLWLHWLGHRHNDRGEFLPLAVALASRGVVSLLPAGHFPWVPDPDGTATDVQRVRDQVAVARRWRSTTSSRSRASTRRGSRWSATTTAGCTASCSPERDERISTMALQAPDTCWENWFASFWLKLDDDARKDYAVHFADLEPVDAVARLAARLGDGLLLQWAGDDRFVTAESRAAYERANPQARSVTYDNADHMLDDRAALDLVAFLADRLGLDQN